MPLQYNIIYIFLKRLRITWTYIFVPSMCKLRFYAPKCYTPNLLAVHLHQLLKEYPSLKVWTKNINPHKSQNFIFYFFKGPYFGHFWYAEVIMPTDNGAIFNFVIFLFKLEGGDLLVTNDWLLGGHGHGWTNNDCFANL